MEHLRERKKQIKAQAVSDGASAETAKAALHDSIHSLKFVPDDEVRAAAEPSSPSPAARATPRVTDAMMALIVGTHVQVKSLGKTETSRFKTFFGPRTPTGGRRKAPYEVTL